MWAAMMRRLGPLAVSALTGLGCGEARLLDSLTEGLTRIRLAPSEFVGSVTCRKGTAGALQSYAVRLQQFTGETETDAGVSTVFTSGVIPCDQAVMFPGVAGSFYAAEIRGFDRAVSEAEVETLPGRWTATCGRGSEGVPDAGLDPFRPTLSLRGATVPMRGCTSFFDGALGSTASQIVVDQPSALGELRCGQRAGEVSGFQASLNGVTRTAPCGEPLVFEVTGPERYHAIALTGFGLDGDAAAPLDAPAGPAPAPAVLDASADAGEALDASLAAEPADAGANPAAPIVGVAHWRTQCVGRSLPGLAAPAYCDPLRPLPSGAGVP
jgi:hypothetical protein